MLSPLGARLVALTAMNGFIATLMAALGSHSFADILVGDQKRWYDIAILMQFGASAGLLGAAVLSEHGRPRMAGRSAFVMALGLLGFCGSLYVNALSGPGSLGAFHWVTPIGGLLMLLAWGMLTVSALRSARGFRG